MSVQKQSVLTSTADKLLFVEGRADAMLLGLSSPDSQKLHRKIRKGVTSGGKAGTVLCAVASNTPKIASKLSPIALNSLRIAGTVGSYVVLACDTEEMLHRSAVYHNITQKLNKTAKDSLEYAILKDMQKRTGILIASSVCGVIMDTFEAAISTGVPILGLPVHIVSFAVAMARIYGEEVIDKRTRKKLQATIKAFEKSRKDLVQDGEGHKEKLEAARLEHQAAKAEKEKSAKALEKATAAYRNPLQAGGSIKRQQEAQESDVLAETRLGKAEKELEKREKDQAELDAYYLGVKLVEDLDPLLAKKNRLEKHIKSYHDLNEKTHGTRFIDSPVGESEEMSFNTDKYKKHLDEKMATLQKEFADVSAEKRNISERMEKQKDYMERMASNRHPDISEAEHRAALQLIASEIDSLDRRKRRLEMDKQHLRNDIAKVRAEISAFEEYQKDCSSLFQVNAKIAERNRKKVLKIQKEHRKLLAEQGHSHSMQSTYTSLPDLNIEHSRSEILQTATTESNSAPSQVLSPIDFIPDSP